MRWQAGLSGRPRKTLQTGTRIPEICERADGQLVQCPGPSRIGFIFCDGLQCIYDLIFHNPANGTKVLIADAYLRFQRLALDGDSKVKTVLLALSVMYSSTKGNFSTVTGISMVILLRY
jgi:hypothetical protein